MTSVMPVPGNTALWNIFHHDTLLLTAAGLKIALGEAAGCVAVCLGGLLLALPAQARADTQKQGPPNWAGPSVQMSCVSHWQAVTQPCCGFWAASSCRCPRADSTLRNEPYLPHTLLQAEQRRAGKGSATCFASRAAALLGRRESCTAARPVPCFLSWWWQ